MSCWQVLVIKCDLTLDVAEERISCFLDTIGGRAHVAHDACFMPNKG